MTKHESSVAESILEATEYPVGLTFDASFHAFAVRLTTLAEDFAQSVLYSHATLPDRNFLRMKARIDVVGLETPQ